MFLHSRDPMVSVRQVSGDVNYETDRCAPIKVLHSRHPLICFNSHSAPMNVALHTEL